jgi:putative flavoprotein involved in K+ transport
MTETVSPEHPSSMEVPHVSLELQLLGRHRSVAVIGGGQAGLSMSYLLTEHGIDHVVLERHYPGFDWRERRWDSFCLVTPNWQCRLPGFAYDGEDPQGFMPRDEVARFIERYAESFDPPLVEGADVTDLTRGADGGFEVSTSLGEVTADQVVIAAGGYHVPRVPPMADRLPGDLCQVHSSEYEGPEDLPRGEVLVVGTGQSGAQIAEDLHLAGRRVHLCLGGAPRVARFYRGRDVTDWLDEMGHYEVPVDEHPHGDRVRLQANHYVTGRGGGHDIDLRRFALEGMRLYGRLTDIDGTKLDFASDLGENLDHADEVSEGIKTAIDEHIEREDLDAPGEERYTPVWRPEREPAELDLAANGIRAVVWCLGFGRDYRWIDVPVFDGNGYPTHERGVTAVKGLYFLGLPWLHTWGSGRFAGIERDARHLAESILERRGSETRSRYAAA